jgi:hypothetical protein
MIFFIDGTARDPVFERHIASKLIQFLKHFHKNPRPALPPPPGARDWHRLFGSPSDTDFDQGAGGILVLPAHARQGTCDVQIQIVANKTRVAVICYTKFCGEAWQGKSAKEL